MAPAAQAGRVRVALVPRARRRPGRSGTPRPTAGRPDGQDGPPVAAGRPPRPAHLARVRGRSHDTIQLGTNVVIVPEHQPAVLAKTAATLDALSGGRVLLGVGVGELPEEYVGGGDGVHEPWSKDGRVARGHAGLWREEIARTTASSSRSRGPLRPSPPRGTIPLHVGGTSRPPLRRAARTGDGYFPYVGPGHASTRADAGSPGCAAESDRWVATRGHRDHRRRRPHHRGGGAHGRTRCRPPRHRGAFHRTPAGPRRAGNVRRTSHRAHAGTSNSSSKCRYGVK